jgi:acetyltransferase
MADYPARLAVKRRLADGRTVLIRPVRAEDQALEQRFFESLSAQTRRLRFMKPVTAVNARLVHFFTHVDYDRHLAFVCEHAGSLVGEARYVANPGGRSCEFAVVVADDWHRSGIARLLIEALIDAARARGMETMEGLVLRENHAMLRFVEKLGFELSPEPHEPAIVRVVKKLRLDVRYGSSSRQSSSASSMDASSGHGR